MQHIQCRFTIMARPHTDKHDCKRTGTERFQPLPQDYGTNCHKIWRWAHRLVFLNRVWRLILLEKYLTSLYKFCLYYNFVMFDNFIYVLSRLLFINTVKWYRAFCIYHYKIIILLLLLLLSVIITIIIIIIIIVIIIIIDNLLLWRRANYTPTPNLASKHTILTLLDQNLNSTYSPTQNKDQLFSNLSSGIGIIKTFYHPR